MFENILGHDNVVSLIKEEILSRNFPQSVLIYGPDYAGKLSLALEIARILSCENKTAQWACDCSSCRKSRLLLNTNLVMLGTRYFIVEISAAADVFSRFPKASTAFLFIRAVRKLVKRFAPVVWEEEGAKIKRAFEITSQIEECLDELDPFRLPEDRRILEQRIAQIVDLSGELVKYNTSTNIPIHNIRRINYWARLSGMEKRKIIILENVHYMQESSCNALLKILEEPPKNVFFLLLTTKKSALIKTILSRLRPYHLSRRSEEQERAVLKKIFHEDLDEYGNLRDYFCAWKEINSSVLSAHARKYIDFILNRKKSIDIIKEMEPVLSSSNLMESIMLLAGEVLAQLEAHFRKPAGGRGISLEHFEKWKDILTENINYMESLNLNPRLVLENTFLKMRSVP